MSTINAKDGSRPTDNRGLNRYNHSTSDTNSKSDNKRSNDSKITGYQSRSNSDTRNNTYSKNVSQGQSRDNKPASYGGKDNTRTNGTKAFTAGTRENKYKSSYGSSGRDNYGGGYGFRKDDDYEGDKNYGKGKAIGQRNDLKAKSSQSKEKEPQTDKMETIKRLEKEKKVLERKNQVLEKDNIKQTRPLNRKRMGNKDWTKGYEKGMYGDDDEEDYTDYY